MTTRAVWAALALAAAGCGAASEMRADRTARARARQSVLADEEAAPTGTEVAMVAAAEPPSPGGGGAPPPPSTPPAPPRLDDEKLVVEAWIELSTPSVTKAAATIRGQVNAAGGRIVEEQLAGNAADATDGVLRIRMPPRATAGFLDGLAELGQVTARRVQATDVGKKLFDLDLALKNHREAMERLEQLLKKPQLTTADILAIEKETTRLRGEIEKIEGERRWLNDHVDFATIEINLHREGGAAVFAPEARIHPGAHLTLLTLWDAGARETNRLGGGVTLHLDRSFTTELSLFPSVNGEGQTLLATIGGGMYSQFLGDGKRRFFNPYIGFRLGYGYLGGGSRFVVAGEVGVELLKAKYVLVDLSVRGLGLFGEEQDGALQTTLGVAVPF